MPRSLSDSHSSESRHNWWAREQCARRLTSQPGIDCARRLPQRAFPAANTTGLYQNKICVFGGGEEFGRLAGEDKVVNSVRKRPSSPGLSIIWLILANRDGRRCKVATGVGVHEDLNSGASVTGPHAEPRLNTRSAPDREVWTRIKPFAAYRTSEIYQQADA